ncbi:MAG: hypothetical protein JNG90_06695 [Planctomycetaceae bacterium]|nr:hypothetical protein [Planctomycetaceae bacterium]
MTTSRRGSDTRPAGGNPSVGGEQAEQAALMSYAADLLRRGLKPGFNGYTQLVICFRGGQIQWAKPRYRDGVVRPGPTKSLGSEAELVTKVQSHVASLIKAGRKPKMFGEAELHMTFVGGQCVAIERSFERHLRAEDLQKAS